MKSRPGGRQPGGRNHGLVDSSLVVKSRPGGYITVWWMWVQGDNGELPMEADDGETRGACTAMRGAKIVFILISKKGHFL